MRSDFLLMMLLPLTALTTPPCHAQEPEKTVTEATQSSVPAPVRTEFHVRYITGTTVYVDGGRGDGLAEGTLLILKQAPTLAATIGENKPVAPGIVAQLIVVSVASTSAVCEVTHTSREIVVGDSVWLPQKEVKKLIETHDLGNTRQYPMIISFTEGDPLDEEVRETQAHPPLPEINQAQGRIGFDLSTIKGLGPNNTSSTVVGMILRADISRIYGTHWNLNGYWRGRLQTSSTTSRPSLQDLMNRTYQMSLSYINPQSNWSAGIGRLYIPWASSLEAIDGGYVDRRISTNTLVGLFAGSTPDPTAWNYNPRRKIGGLFLNVHGGSYDNLWYTSTAGLGVNLLNWSVDRPFVFSENDFSYKRIFSMYHSLQIDRPTVNPSMPAVGVGVGQSLLSLRVQVHPRVSLDLTHTYFRDVPTYDPALVGTGLLDKYLYQGVNAGARISLPMHITPYFSLGRSGNSSDPKASLNTLVGISMADIWKTGLMIDARYSRFNSAFAAGTYRNITISRDLGERFRLNLQGGQQMFNSTLSKGTGTYFINSLIDANLGSRYFIESGFTTQRGGPQEYNQWTATFGYRFNNRSSQRKAAHALQP